MGKLQDPFNTFILGMMIGVIITITLLGIGGSFRTVDDRINDSKVILSNTSVKVCNHDLSNCNYVDITAKRSKYDDGEYIKSVSVKPTIELTSTGRHFISYSGTTYDTMTYTGSSEISIK